MCKLEWIIPKERDDGTDFSLLLLDKMSATRAKTINGLSSTKAYWGTQGGLTLILDESKGTDKGYDTLYIIQTGGYSSKPDIGKAVKVPLKDYGGLLGTYGMEEATIQVPIGVESSKITKPLAVSVRIEPRSKPGGIVGRLTQFRIRGGWRGKIETDKGDLTVLTQDLNGNGVYGDSFSEDNDGDGVSIIAADESLAINIPITQYSMFGDKFYTIHVNKLGDSVDIQTYSGPMAKLVIQAVDGYNKPAKATRIFISGDEDNFDFGPEADESFSTDGKPIRPGYKELSVPVKNYTGIKAAVVQSSSSGADSAFALFIEKELDFVLEKDKETTIKLGGPVKMQIAPKRKELTLRRGMGMGIGIALTAGTDEVVGIQGGRTVKVSISAPNGKQVWSGTAEFGSIGSCAFSVKIPQDWKPGNYKITATFDPSPYSAPVTAYKTLKVIK